VTLREHGRHSEITQAQVRAWGEDAKRDSNQQNSDSLVKNESGCDGCGADDDVLWESDDDSDFNGERCTECVTDLEVSGTLQSA